MTELNYSKVEAASRASDRTAFTYAPRSAPGTKKIGLDGIDEKHRDPATKWFGDMVDKYGDLSKLQQVSREKWLEEMGSRGWRLSGHWGGSWLEDDYEGKHDRLVYTHNRAVISAVYYERRGSSGSFVAYYYLAPKQYGPAYDDRPYISRGDSDSDSDAGLHE